MSLFISRNQGYTMKIQVHISVHAALRNCRPKMSTWILGQLIFKKPINKVKGRV